MSITNLFGARDRDDLDAVDPAATLDPAGVQTPPPDAGAGADLEHPDPTDLDADDTTDVDEDNDQDADEGSDSSKASRDAARYRRRLRDAEARIAAAEEQLAAADERVQAAEGRITALQRQRVEDIAARVLPEPKLLWKDGADPADLLDDAGDLDPEKIADLARSMATTYGVRQKLDPSKVQQLPRANLRSLGSGTPLSAADRFTEAFKPKH